jgi:hypothetical protein
MIGVSVRHQETVSLFRDYMVMSKASKTFISFNELVHHGLSPCWRCSRQLHRMYICLCFPFLSQVTTVSWKMRGLSAKRARSICGVHLLAGAVKEDYEAGPKMAHVTADTCCQVWGAWGVQQNGPSPVRTGCSPQRDRCEDGRTCARTG